MGSGTQRQVVGAVIGTGALLNVKTIGFRPSAVQLLNVAGLVKAEWTKGMADDSCLKQINHDTAQLVAVSSDGVIPLSNGFSIGADTDINVDGEKIHYVAQE